MARLLIDGYNVLLAAGPGAGEAEREELVREAARYRAERGIDVVVVFDSRTGGHRAEATGHAGVSVEFAPGDADAAILEAVRRSRSPRDVRVVTNDRRLAAAVRDLGGRTEDVAAFRRRARKGPRPAARRPTLVHSPALPKKEVEEWLRVFAERPERGEDDGET